MGGYGIGKLVVKRMVIIMVLLIPVHADKPFPPSFPPSLIVSPHFSSLISCDSSLISCEDIR